MLFPTKGLMRKSAVATMVIFKDGDNYYSDQELTRQITDAKVLLDLFYKEVRVYYDNSLHIPIGFDLATMKFEFSSGGGGGSTDDCEKLVNKVTSDTGITPVSTDTQYPSAKTVFEFVADAMEHTEDPDNKVTSITSTSTDTQYPSAKAVYDLFNSIPDASNTGY